MALPLLDSRGRQTTGRAAERDTGEAEAGGLERRPSGLAPAWAGAGEVRGELVQLRADLAWLWAAERARVEDAVRLGSRIDELAAASKHAMASQLAALGHARDAARDVGAGIARGRADLEAVLRTEIQARTEGVARAESRAAAELAAAAAGLAAQQRANADLAAARGAELAERLGILEAAVDGRMQGAAGDGAALAQRLTIAEAAAAAAQQAVEAQAAALSRLEGDHAGAAVAALERLAEIECRLQAQLLQAVSAFPGVVELRGGLAVVAAAMEEQRGEARARSNAEAAAREDGAAALEARIGGVEGALAATCVRQADDAAMLAALQVALGEAGQDQLAALRSDLRANTLISEVNTTLDQVNTEINRTLGKQRADTERRLDEAQTRALGEVAALAAALRRQGLKV
ncbi:hypothetical protein WJX81_001756 [Elliptochloris bilobata]|uniref:Uncharacterized protein n=1 Tax=Elliptochloris bilobata TaxID=381761 RepID=A0AAW1RDZ2_9CHLO